MNAKDRAFVVEEVARQKRRIVVGLCGLCGRELLLGSVGDEDGQKSFNAFCSGCGSKPQPMAMQERRRVSRK